MIKHIKDELTELLLKIGETNLNQSDLFTSPGYASRPGGRFNSNDNSR